MANVELISTVQAILTEHAELGGPAASLAIEEDLYDSGMTSRATVNVMLALEGAFDVEFPDDMLQRSVFESVSSICAAIATLQTGPDQ